MTTSDGSVWVQTLDDGVYTALVTQTDDPYRGVLELWRGDTVKLKSEPVSIAYGAPFGPDVDDVTTWQLIILEWLHEYEGKSDGTAQEPV